MTWDLLPASVPADLRMFRFGPKLLDPPMTFHCLSLSFD